MTRPINRIEPKIPVQGMKTYGIESPAATHTRPASCTEVGCVVQANGWETHVDETSALGQRQAAYIRTQSARRFTEAPDGCGTVFTFPPGEECFQTHRVPLDRPELYVVRGGDWRGNPRGERHVHTDADAWLNDFGEHQETLRKTIEG